MNEHDLDMMLEMPDEPIVWPILHDDLFIEVSERWCGTMPSYYAHA